jgi:hypothetical protein
MTQHSSIHKWLTIGIILLFTTTGLSSIITAQNNTMAPKSSSIPQTENIFPKKMSDIFKQGDLPRHLFLLLIVKILFIFRYTRGEFIFDRVVTYGHNGTITTNNPLLALRGYWLMISAWIWYYYWAITSDTMGWNWNLW